MATPLYNKMKNKGTSFYVFPNAIKDFSLANFQDSIKISPSKFILLNIPKSVTGNTSSPGVLDFVKSTDPISFGSKIYSFDPNGPRSGYKYSDELVESLRNYIANCDTVYRESKITIKKDFYNPSENKTPTEMIFWKWCKKMNILDLEPAAHKIDWDKNLTDFQNINASTFTNKDYFRKYLWKERETITHNFTVVSNNGMPEITMDNVDKFKPNDKVVLLSYDGEGLTTGATYYVNNVNNNENKLILNVDNFYNIGSGTLQLDYHRLVQYIGEVQAVSKVQTSENNFTEFTAMIPPHAGMTPTILFDINQNSNYYPGLELPILSEEIQMEIKGAEYLSSPIRTNPGDYPGSYFGYFDTYDKTYINSNGDSVRLSGDYFGILRSNNNNLIDDNHSEKLTEFNSDNIDGLVIDFNRKHYLKMNLPGSTVKNFDEFNSMVINNEPPLDFEYNAILWYYDLDDGSGYINTNLYGIEFLNNPDDDFGSNDDKIISTTRKLVSNSNQDGLSYIYNLNIDFKVDNDMSPLKYDTTSIYNLFGFDLYNNVMANYGKLNQNFMTIITDFIIINKKLLDLESIIYSQTDIDEIKSKLNNFEELLKMYQTNQFVDSDTIEIEIDYTKNYPALKFHAKYVEYDEIFNIFSEDIIKKNIKNELSPYYDVFNQVNDPFVGLVQRGVGWIINVPNKGRTLVNIYSNIVNDYPGKTLSLTLDKDLNFKQSIDIIVRTDICNKFNDLQINVMFDDGKGQGREEKILIESFDLPIDVETYNADSPYESILNNAYYYDLSTHIDFVTTGATIGGLTGGTSYTRIDINEDLFTDMDWVYIDGFKFKDSDGKVLDYSGLYKVVDKIGIQLYLDWDTANMDIELYGKPKIFYYKGVKYSILRVDNSPTSSIRYRYIVYREFLTSDYIQNLNL